MELIHVDSSSAESYDTFVQTHGGELFQSFAWGEFQKKIPGREEAWAYGVKEGKRWLGGVLMVKQRLPIGLCWLSVARGPVFAQGVDAPKVWAMLFREISARANLEKAVFLRVEPAEGCALALFTSVRKGNDAHSLRSWLPAHAHYQPEWTLRVDLRPSEEDILKQMESKGRYNARLAAKKGVTVRATQNPKDAAHFYQILQKTGERDRFGIHAEPYYKTFLEEGARGKWGALFLAEHEGKAIAGALVTFYGKTGTYFYGASDHAYRSLMAPYLLQWEAMCEAKRQGCEWYDFLGIAPPDEPKHVWRGVTEFKEKFGGVRVQYPAAREFVFKPFWYAIVRGIKILKGHR
jgi:lipid II:glycine glycyltransferase (peptidoglycan interpeptide bridge formation enzyme)